MSHDKVDLKTLLLTMFLQKMPPRAQHALTSVLEDLIFPWYELQHPSRPSNKNMRDSIAERVEQGLSATVWKYNGPEIVAQEEEEDEEEPSEVIFIPSSVIVSQVFPSSAMDNVYELMVHVVALDDRSNQKVMTLNEFLETFVPEEKISFDDLDA